MRPGWNATQRHAPEGAAHAHPRAHRTQPLPSLRPTRGLETFLGPTARPTPPATGTRFPVSFLLSVTVQGQRTPNRRKEEGAEAKESPPQFPQALGGSNPARRLAFRFERREEEFTRDRPRFSLPGMVPSDRVSVSSTAAADELLHGPVPGKKIQKKAPRKVHKAEREKLKRDQLNDLFIELGHMLAEDRQNNGKACILADTTRILRGLLSQVESLRKENSALQSESHYVTAERDELRDETSALGKEILELQSELRTRLSSNSGWGHGTGESNSASAVFPSQQPVQPPSEANTEVPLQQPLPSAIVIELPYAAAPRELKLFPKAGSEAAEDEEATSHVTRPQARYPIQAASWPVSLFSGLPRMEDEQCSSTTTGSSKEATSTGRA